MSILDWLAKKQSNKPQTEKLNIPGDLWVKCKSCGEVIFVKDLESNFKVCSHCGFHFRITPAERLNYFFDKGTFKEIDSDISPVDFLEFTDTEPYKERIEKAQKKTKKKEAVMIGEVQLNGELVNVGIMDFSFMGGSMGSVVGEKITRLIEHALKNKGPVIIFTSSGGARMQEGITSLMQMAKTSAALAKLSEAGIPYISVLCDPTTGGTSASFAMLGDIHIAEPGALISFAGPRVIEQTIRQKLPKGFQRAEFLLEHGMIDMVVVRKDLRQKLIQILEILNSGK
jgi:acetyl-CoA carboxylase carboxyl transferase subunit beta